MISYASRILEHVWWADDLTARSLRTLDNPDSDLIELYAHLIAAEHVWMDRIEGVPQSVDVWPDWSVEEAVQKSEEAQERYARFLQSLPPRGLQQNVVYVNSRGDQFESTIEDILLHVALHGSYHRGQLARAVRQNGGTPAGTDYIGYIRGVPAATRDDVNNYDESYYVDVVGSRPGDDAPPDEEPADPDPDSPPDRPDIPLL